MSSINSIFRPKSVAVVGASSKKGILGREIFDLLLGSGFNGPVFPVNPNAEYVHSVKAYRSIQDIPQAVDLAVIVVPKERVLSIVQDCAQKGVKGLILITAGFRETGAEGAIEEKKIVAIVKKHGMRMIGPNCMGVVNSEPDVRLSATFAATRPGYGSVALASQSGALGQAILEQANDLNLGISMFASVGNKADITGVDLLRYWGDEESIEVILMYLEGFGDGQTFIELAKKISRNKPIIVVKSGRTAAGAQAASSHTGALAGTDAAYDALFKQCGVIRANTINEMFNYALAFAHVPLPQGPRVAVITNAGGPGILAVDALENSGLTVASLGAKTQASLRAGLVADASVVNPVDLLAGATPEQFQLALTAVLADDEVDAAIVIFVTPIITNPTEVAIKISAATQSFDKPVLGCFMGIRGITGGIEELQRNHIPAYTFPEPAAYALAAMVNYQEWLRLPHGKVQNFDVDYESAKAVIHTTKTDSTGFLDNEGVEALLDAYRVPRVKSKTCVSLDELLAAQALYDCPVVLKVSSQHVLHKSDVGGVKLALKNEKELKNAYDEMVASLTENNIPVSEVRFVIQQMVTGGREVIMGLKKVGDMGTLVMFGLGGVYVEVLQDVAFRLAPLSDQDVEELVREIKGYQLLSGVRGDVPVAFNVIKEALLRLSQMAIDFPEIQEFDINPFIVSENAAACLAVDGRIRI